MAFNILEAVNKYLERSLSSQVSQVEVIPTIESLREQIALNYSRLEDILTKPDRELRSIYNQLFGKNLNTPLIQAEKSRRLGEINQELARLHILTSIFERPKSDGDEITLAPLGHLYRGLLEQSNVMHKLSIPQCENNALILLAEIATSHDLQVLSPEEVQQFIRPNLDNMDIYEVMQAIVALPFQDLPLQQLYEIARSKGFFLIALPGRIFATESAIPNNNPATMLLRIRQQSSIATSQKQDPRDATLQELSNMTICNFRI